MPLTIELALNEADIPAAVLALAPLAGITITANTAANPSGLSISCPRNAKMAVLGALAPLGAKVLDVNIIEPSLADVYFGLREN